MKLGDVFSWLGEVSFSQLWRWYGWLVAGLFTAATLLAMGYVIVLIVMLVFSTVPLWLLVLIGASCAGLYSFHSNVLEGLEDDTPDFL